MLFNERERAIALVIARIFFMLRALEEEPLKNYVEWEIDGENFFTRTGDDPEIFYAEIIKISKENRISLVKVIGVENNKYFIRLTR